MTKNVGRNFGKSRALKKNADFGVCLHQLARPVHEKHHLRQEEYAISFRNGFATQGVAVDEYEYEESEAARFG